MLQIKRKFFGHYEVVLFGVLVVISFIIGFINRAFLSLATIFEIFRGSIPYALMGLGILPVLLLGEVDISFVGIAATTSLVAHVILKSWGYTGGIGGYILIACPLGAVLALIVGLIAALFSLPVFAVSLGFWLMLYGFNLFFVSPEMRFDLPKGLVGFYGQFLVKVHDPIVGETGLHMAVVYVLLAAVVIWIVLRYTVIGRGFYVMGGNREVAIRTGYSPVKLLCIAMAVNGTLAALAGVLQCAFKRFFDPILFRGTELNVIAAAVIGGASITGGRGSVIGVLLGILFVQVVTRGLIYLGVEPTWQQFVVGSILIIFFVLTSLRTHFYNITFLRLKRVKKHEIGK